MKKFLKKFHDDEEGLEALQVVMILAIAAVILGLLKLYWPRIRTWFARETENIVGDSTGVGGFGAP